MGVQDWATNSVQNGSSPNLPICVFGMAVPCVVLIRALGLGKQVKYNNIRVIIIFSCFFLFLSLLLWLIADVNPNPTKTAIMRDFFAIFLCSGLLQLCDEYILYLRLQASMTITRTMKYLIFSVIWADFLVLWAPSFTLVPLLVNTNSPKFAEFYLINRPLHIGVKLIYNLILASLYYRLYKAIEDEKGQAAACRQTWSTVIYNLSYNDGKMSDNKQVILVKSLLYCAFSSVGCIIWLALDDMPGLAIYEILVVISQYFLHGSEFSSTINGMFHLWQKKSVFVIFKRKIPKNSHFGPMYEQALVGDGKDLYEYGRLRSPYPSSDGSVSCHIPEMYSDTLTPLNTVLSPRSIVGNAAGASAKSTPSRAQSTFQTIGTTLHSIISSRNGTFSVINTIRDSGHISSSKVSSESSSLSKQFDQVSPHKPSSRRTSSSGLLLYEKEGVQPEDVYRIKPSNGDTVRNFDSSESESAPGQHIPLFGILNKRLSGLQASMDPPSLSKLSTASGRDGGTDAKVIPINVTNDVPLMIANWQAQPSSTKSSLHSPTLSMKNISYDHSDSDYSPAKSQRSGGADNTPSRKTIYPKSPALAYIKAMSVKAKSGRLSRRNSDIDSVSINSIRSIDEKSNDYDHGDIEQNFYMASRKRNSFVAASYSGPMLGAITTLARAGREDLPLQRESDTPLDRHGNTLSDVRDMVAAIDSERSKESPL